MRFDDVREVEETDSTNSRLLEEARAGAPEGVVLVADHQTAGRGRLGRRWEAPPGSALLVSVLLRPDVALGRAHLVTMAAGLAASDACEAVAGVRPGLKWPNDLVVDDAKLAGLLAESVVEGDGLRALVVGMGLNLTAAPAEGATALADHTAATIDRRALLDAWLERLNARLDALGEVLDDYRPRCATLGRDVRVERPDGSTVEGRAADVTDAGHLVVDTGTDRVEVAVGDVVHVRPSRGGSQTRW